jgi:hypothetical protein
LHLRTNGRAGELDGFELGVADTLTGLVGLHKVRRRYLQPRTRRRAADEPQQQKQVRSVRIPSMSPRSGSEQPVLDGVPLRRPRGINGTA